MKKNLHLRQKGMVMRGKITLAAALGLFAVTANANIISAVDGTINSGGPGSGTLTETFDQSGLSDNYTAGDDFDTFVASTTHTTIFFGFEWFSNAGTTAASVTYDLGDALGIDALALWNEESSGIGLLDLFWSTDNVTFNSLAAGLMPTDHLTTLVDYSADVFSFGAVNARYIRFDMSGCPQQGIAGFPGCAIGEVAFRAATVGGGGPTAVPEPGTLLLLGGGLLGLGFVRRRRSI